MEIKLSELHQANRVVGLFFNIRDTYGFMRLRLDARSESVELDLGYLFNPDGGINLIAHDQNDEPIYKLRKPRGDRTPALETATRVF